MVLVEASKLNLPQSPSSHPQILSANYDPNSRSLALTHPDSSLSLYTPISQQPQHQTLTLIPPHISSSTFLILKSNPTSNLSSLYDEDNTRVIFVVASPVKAGALICLRFYGVVRKGASQVFNRVNATCKHKDCFFDEKLGAVVIKVSHGVGIRLSGDVNVFTMYSASSSKIWVFAVKMVSDGDGQVLKLMKCAVIECNLPIWCVFVAYGYLILGEDNGVRVFALRPLVKGNGGSKSMMHDAKHKGRQIKGRHTQNVVKKPNGVVWASNGGFVMEGGSRKLINNQEVGSKFDTNGMTVERSCDDHSDQKCNTHHGSDKLKSVKVGYESGIFKSFNDVNPALEKSTNSQLATAKATSIKAMSANKFLILDSLGNLHLLGISNFVGPKLNLQMRQLDQFMKVQKFAVLPGTQTVWISDGFYTVRMMILDDIDPADNESGEHANDGNPTISGNQLILTSEKIQDVVSLSANAILIFGQDKFCWPMAIVSHSRWPSCKFLNVNEVMHCNYVLYPHPICFVSSAVSSARRMMDDQRFKDFKLGGNA